MAYLKITDIDGKEHELQVINEDRDVLISRGFGKFLSFKEIIEDYLDKISDLKKEVSIYKERAEIIIPGMK